MIRALAALAIMALAPSAGAAERPQDYAYAMPIAVDGGEALYQVELPVALYRGVAHADLRDVRVFNASGEPVPHAMRPRAHGAEGKPETVPLPYFPLRGNRERGIDELRVHVERRADGTLVDIRNAQPRGSAAEAVVGYLFDASRLKQPFRSLSFEWKTPASGFAGKVRIEGSDDLTRWSTIAGDASLVDLEFGGHRLEQRRVEFGPRRFDYLRLSWPRGEKAIELTGVRAEIVSAVPEPHRAWVTLTAPEHRENAGEYEYDAGGYIPFDRLRIALPQANTLAQVRILGRSKPDEPWRFSGSALVYRLRRDGEEVTSAPVVLNGRAERFILLRVDQKGGGIGSGAPMVSVGWIPQQLVFGARGEGPFRLAYGNHAARAAAFPIASLIPGYSTDKAFPVRPATLGESVTLGGAQQLRAPVDYKRWALWLTLILGVAALAYMAYRLLRQMNHGEARSDKAPPDGPA